MSGNANELFDVLANIPKDKQDDAVRVTSAFLKGVEVGATMSQDNRQ